MEVLAVFGITNDGLNLAVTLLLLFLVVLWIALVYWTYADARRRIEDPMLVGCAVAASLFPFLGTVVYVVVRPPEFLEDVHERELEIAAAQARLDAVLGEACPHCEHPVETSFLRCPSCANRLRYPCRSCGKALDPRWKVCPYCEAEVERASGQAQRRERGRERPPASSEAARRAPAADPPRRKAADGSARGESASRKASKPSGRSSRAPELPTRESPPSPAGDADPGRAPRKARSSGPDGGGKGDSPPRRTRS